MTRRLSQTFGYLLDQAGLNAVDGSRVQVHQPACRPS